MKREIVLAILDGAATVLVAACVLGFVLAVLNISTGRLQCTATW